MKSHDHICKKGFFENLFEKNFFCFTRVFSFLFFFYFFLCFYSCAFFHFFFLFLLLCLGTEMQGLSCDRVCSICKLYDKKCKLHIVVPYYHIVYCMKCKDNGNVKRELLLFFETHSFVPCFFLNKYAFKFYRQSKTKIEEGKLMFGMNSKDGFFHIPKGQNEYGVNLTFGDGANRCVPLSNILKHSEGLYELITTATNILGDSEIVISFLDLPKSLQDLFAVSEQIANAKNSQDFLY